MLTKCPECELPVSDKAVFCPHCGYGLKEDAKISTPRRKKRMRLPNGFGQITEIKDRSLRKPFRAMVTTGKNEVGRPICKPLKPTAYFETYNEAYAALVEYNKRPYDLDSSMTVNELHNLWAQKHYATIGESRAKSLEACWRYCHDIYGVRVADVRPKHIEHCMTNGTSSFNGTVHPTTDAVRRSIKAIFNSMFDYAVLNDIVKHNTSREYIYKSTTKAHSYEKKHMSFTDEEMEALWAHEEGLSVVSLMLVQCYSGWRPQELCLLRREDVDLDEWTFSGGMKTEAGKDRCVPIHPKIQNIVKRWYDVSVKTNNDYLFASQNRQTREYTEPLTYRQYQYHYNKTITDLNLDPKHSPHDGRLQFITMAKRSRVDEYAIKYIVGHVINDVTEKVYTYRDPNWLREEIEKIK